MTSSAATPAPFGCLNCAIPPWGAFAVAGLAFIVLGVVGAVSDPWRADESYTFHVATSSWPALFDQVLQRDTHPPLFYLLMSLWLRLWAHPAAMQAFTLLCGLIGVVFAGWTAFNIAGRRAAIWSAFLWATFPIFLHYCQDARMYPLALLWELLALWGWSARIERPRLGWVIMVLALTAALYTHNHCPLFAAALLGGEAARCLWQKWRRPSQPAAGAGLRWIVSAGVVVVLFYLPWVPALRHQMQYPYISDFNAPTWLQILNGVAILPWSVRVLDADNWFAALPGPLLLGALLLTVFLARRGKIVSPAPDLINNANSRRLLLAVSLGPMLFLILYSQLRQPVFEISRQGVLFLPLALIPAACWLARFQATRAMRVTFTTVTALLMLNAFFVLREPRDPDLRPDIVAILSAMRPDSPVLTLPYSHPGNRLLWAPLPLCLLPSDQLDSVTHCTLVVTPGSGPQRQALIDRTRLILGRAAKVRNLYTSYYVQAYGLEGLPPGAINGILEVDWTQPDPTLIARHLGALSTEWASAAPALNRDCQPPGQNVTLALGDPTIRLNTSVNRISLNAPKPANSIDAHNHYLACCLSGQAVFGETSRSLRFALGAAAHMREFPSGTFLESFIISRPASAQPSPLEMEIHLPKDLAGAAAAPAGDVPPGLYVRWAGLVPLSPAHLRREGFDGTYVDIGALGDDLFIRSFCHEREGVPSANHRWMTDELTLEIPLWPGRDNRTVVLFGILPEAIADRGVRLTLRRSDLPSNVETKRSISAQGKIPTDDYGACEIALPVSLEPGIWQLEIKLGGYFIPREIGQGNDPRKLGFYFDGIGIR